MVLAFGLAATLIAPAKTFGPLVLTLGLAFMAGALFMYEPRPPELKPLVLEPGLRLCLMREELKLSQRGLAKILPVSQSTINRMELGKIGIRREIWEIMMELNPSKQPTVESDGADHILPESAAPVPSAAGQTQGTK